MAYTVLTRGWSFFWRALVILTALCGLVSPTGVIAGDYLSAGDVAAISGGTAVATVLGLSLGDFDSTRSSLIGGPLLFEKSLQRLLGGDFERGKRNFLSSSLGSAATPVAGGVILAAVDGAWPLDHRGKLIAQDLFLYTAGLITTKGITSSFKGAFARPRPYVYFAGRTGEFVPHRSYSYDHSSFFSGHVSAAFFATTFLNKRLRSVMRRELTSTECDDWNWISPVVLYSWATFVGWTRIQAYDHYLTDVLIGAAAGYLLAELFYSVGDDVGEWSTGQGMERCAIRLTFAF